MRTGPPLLLLGLSSILSIDFYYFQLSQNNKSVILWNFERSTNVIVLCSGNAGDANSAFSTFHISTEKSLAGTHLAGRSFSKKKKRQRIVHAILLP